MLEVFFVVLEEEVLVAVTQVVTVEIIPASRAVKGALLSGE